MHLYSKHKYLIFRVYHLSLILHYDPCSSSWYFLIWLIVYIFYNKHYKAIFVSVSIPKSISLFLLQTVLPKYLSEWIFGVRKEYDILLKFVCLFLKPKWAEHFFFTLCHVHSSSIKSLSVLFHMKYQIFINKSNMLSSQKSWQHQQLRCTVFSNPYHFHFFSFSPVFPALREKTALSKQMVKN